MYIHKIKTRDFHTLFYLFLTVSAGWFINGCGFVPIYGESVKGDARLLKVVKINRIDDRIGQKLRTRLRHMFGQSGPPKKPRWALTVSLTESIRGLAVQRDATTTRRELGVTAKFTLEELTSKRRGRFQGEAISINSFNEMKSEYATLSAENNARTRALQILSDEIRSRVMLAIRNPTFFEK